MPTAMVSAIYCIVFGIITAIGLSNLQYVDLNVFRNLFIVGVAIFNSLAVAGPGGYFATVDGNPFGTTNAAEIAYALFSSPMIIAFIIAFFLDNTVPGTREERGLAIWDKASKVDVNNDPEYVQVYSLPLCFARTFRNCDYLEYIALGRMPAPPAKGYKPGRGDIGDLCCPCLKTPPQEEDEEEEVGRSADPEEAMTLDS
jgi:nucleobase transporter 1/2